MKPLPAHLPPLPENAVYLGMGKTFSTNNEFDGWCFDPSSDSAWDDSGPWSGNVKFLYYAAPKDSPIAILNGLGEPKVDWKKRAEEWETMANGLAINLMHLGYDRFRIPESYPMKESVEAALTAYEALKSKEKL